MRELEIFDKYAEQMKQATTDVQRRSIRAKIYKELINEMGINWVLRNKEFIKEAIDQMENGLWKLH